MRSPTATLARIVLEVVKTLSPFEMATFLPLASWIQNPEVPWIKPHWLSTFLFFVRRCLCSSYESRTLAVTVPVRVVSSFTRHCCLHRPSSAGLSVPPHQISPATRRYRNRQSHRVVPRLKHFVQRSNASFVYQSTIYPRTATLLFIEDKCTKLRSRH